MTAFGTAGARPSPRHGSRRPGGLDDRLRVEVLRVLGAARRRAAFDPVDGEERQVARMTETTGGEDGSEAAPDGNRTVAVEHDAIDEVRALRISRSRATVFDSWWSDRPLPRRERAD